MQIIDGRTDEVTLATIGCEAVQLLCADEIGVLAARFGYTLAFDRELEIAIREDLVKCLNQLEFSGLAMDVEFGQEVTFFQPNDVGLFALIACDIPTINGRGILVELVVTSNGTDKYVTLEDISAIGL